jgi:O-methyltransferase involved in polyketide biosynthesis
VTRETVALARERETLLITLLAKAGESRLPRSLLRDRFAADAVARIDYDFARLKVTRDMMVGIAMRAKRLDDWTRAFIASHPDGSVLHLGCGLDTRVFRIDPGPRVRWLDVDFPEVVALRRRLFPPRDGYTLIRSSVTDQGWLQHVPDDRPAMVVAEGLLMYLRREEVEQLFTRITARVQSGEAAFDAFSRLGVRLVQRQRSVRATGATLRWGIDDPRELEVAVPRLRFVEEVAAYDLAQLGRFSLLSRASIRLAMTIPPLRRLGRFLRYRFGSSPSESRVGRPRSRTAARMNWTPLWRPS